MEKLSYEVDPHNRLVIRGRDGKTELPRFRKVLDGRFKIDKNNRLTYHVKAPIPEEIKSPHQVKLKGEWSLDKNHNLVFTLDKWKRQTFGDQLTLRGQIIEVNKNSLLFALTTRDKENVHSIYALRLEGSWRADKNNRLAFRVRREPGEYDILTFYGIWKTGKNYQVIYQYRKEQLKRKLKKIHTLTFKGYWKIKDRARISYVIDRDIGSVFDFKTSLGIFRDNYIKYELGIGAKPVKRVVTFFGEWKIKKNSGLVFEVRQEDKKVQAIIFGAQARLARKNEISFKLRNELNREIGAELELSHRILKGDGRAFLRALKSRQEFTILAGAGWGW